MAHLSLREVLLTWGLRPDVFATLTQHLELFEKETGRTALVADDGGLRSTARQARLYADSTRAGSQAYRVAKPGQSPHELGAAYDLHIVGGRNDDRNPDPLFAQLAAIGERLGMVAGYHFKSGLPDPFHFETKETTSVRQEKWGAVIRGRLQRIGLLVGGLAVAGLAVIAHRHHRHRSAAA